MSKKINPDLYTKVRKHFYNLGLEMIGSTYDTVVNALITGGLDKYNIIEVINDHTKSNKK